MIDLSSQFVIFGVPTLSNNVCVEFLVSMLATTRLLEASGCRYDLMMIGGDPFIANARNRISADFLNHSQATDLFWIDDDVGWPAVKVLEFLDSSHDIIMGVPPTKIAVRQFPCDIEHDAQGQLIERDGLYKAHMGPTGFMRVKRRVLDRLAAVSPHYGELGAKPWPAIFETGVYNGTWCGEDRVFLDKWHKLGGEAWIDPSIVFSHRGAKKWIGRLGDSILRPEAAL